MLVVAATLLFLNSFSYSANYSAGLTKTSVNTATVNYQLSRTVKVVNLTNSDVVWGTGTDMGGGYILTARHLNKSDNPVNIFSVYYYGQNLARPAKRAYLSTRSDIMFLKLDTNIPTLIKLGDVQEFDNIVLIGNPEESNFVVVNSYIISKFLMVDPNGYIRSYLIFPCNGARPGFSGSGVFNDKEELVGVFTFAFAFNGFCGAWNIDDIKRELKEADIPGYN